MQPEAHIYPCLQSIVRYLFFTSLSSSPAVEFEIPSRDLPLSHWLLNITNTESVRNVCLVYRSDSVPIKLHALSSLKRSRSGSWSLWNHVIDTGSAVRLDDCQIHPPIHLRYPGQSFPTKKSAAQFFSIFFLQTTQNELFSDDLRFASGSHAFLILHQSSSSCVTCG